MWVHFGYHLVASSALIVVLLWSRAWSPAADALARRTRWALRAGLILTLAGQLLEAAGAFGYPDDRRTNLLANMHDAGVVVGPVGILLIIFALVLAVALALGTRMGWRESRWFIISIAVAGVAAAAFLIGAFVFGY